jgi:hypothetical protein
MFFGKRSAVSDEDRPMKGPWMRREQEDPTGMMVFNRRMASDRRPRRAIRDDSWSTQAKIRLLRRNKRPAGI